MPSFKTAGKTKDDLVVVVQLAGLLTADEASAMTRTQLIKILKDAEKSTDQPDQPAASADAGPSGEQTAPKKRKPGRPRSSTQKKTRTTRSSASQNDFETVSDPAAGPSDEAVSAQSAASTTATGEKTKTRAAAGRAAASRAKSVSRSRRATSDDKHEEPAAEQPLSTDPAISDPRTSTTVQTESEVKAQTADKAEEPAAETKKTDAQPAGAEAKTVKDSGRRKAPSNKRQSSRASAPGRSQKKNSQADAGRNDTSETAGISAESSDGRSPSAERTASNKAIPEKKEKENVIRFQPRRDPASEETSPEAATAASDKPMDETRPDDQLQNRTSRDQQRPSAEPANATATIQREARPNGHGQDANRARRPQVEAGEQQAGVLEIMQDGYGFLRRDNYLQGNKDIYVPPQYIRRFGLRQGDHVTGTVKLQRDTDRYQALLYIKEVNGMSPEKMVRRPHFDRLTPIYPDERLVLESVRNELSTRIIDLVAPIGKGQRGMIVSPPKAGKTILLQKIANAISINNPAAKLIVLLIDERPEEVTDMQRSINGEVVYSTFDKTPENHTKVTELVLERSMRLVELGQDVVILLDSMTRLARAYNLTINPTGRTLSGGLDPGALYGPKRFFGAARNIENGGSLTIIATSLIETGSRMDEVIFEEFKGTGNMEVYLDRKLSEKRIFPAIDINKSGTRREELLLSSKELDAVWTIRKAFSQLDTSAVTEAIINLLLKTQNNEHFISSINVSFNDKNVFDAMRGTRPSQNGSSYKNGYNG